MNEFTHEGRVKHAYAVMEPSFIFHTLVKNADAGNIRIEDFTLLTYHCKLILQQIKYRKPNIAQSLNLYLKRAKRLLLTTEITE